MIIIIIIIIITIIIIIIIYVKIEASRRRGAALRRADVGRAGGRGTAAAPQAPMSYYIMLSDILYWLILCYIGYTVLCYIVLDMLYYVM